MIDAKVRPDNHGRFDISIDSGQIEQEDGLETAIWVSLFTDARADSSQVARPEYRRGWPGNLVSQVEGRQLGGLLWLIDQRRLTQGTLNAAIDYARGALSWMVTDGLLLSVEVSGAIVPRYGIQLNVVLTSRSGATETKYVKLWEATINAN